ncbi:MAG TPA: substrate-binding domain-containing protein [Candidatus Dormibacteraeota bacterium]|nr:substrate-binding domain-containing protein [Candidatus Dormibacteraeota bacterium]
MKFARFAAVVLTGVCLAACGSGPASQAVPHKKLAFLAPEVAPRFESQDRPLFGAKLQSLCEDCELIYRNAGGDPVTQMQQAQAVLAAGVNVIVLDPVDPAGASAIVAAAARRHVPVIAYDRMVLNTSGVSYFIGFDNAAVGVLQAGALLRAMKGASMPAVVMMHGDPANPDSAVLKKAVHTTLDGKVTIAKEFDTPSASAENAQLEMTQALAATKNKVDGVYAANDDVAAGAIQALKTAGLKELPPVTGGDTELPAVQRIIAGEQYMTIYRPVKQEVEAAAVIAYDLAFGVPVPVTMTAGATVNNSARDVPAVLIEPLAVTRRELISTVVADGFWTRTQICTAEYARACRAAGLS